jgi:KDO2-lipid IV(A) lauroyltransferase
VISGLYYKIDKKRRNIALNNIKSSFPKYCDDYIKEIAVESFKNLVLTFFEMFRIPSMSKDDIKEKIKFENLEILKKEIELGNGIIFLSAHYGNWELMSVAGSIWLEKELLIPVKLLKNSIVDKYINGIRTIYGNSVVNMDQAARKIIFTLRNGGALALLGDQSAHENKDIFVDFFGRPALTYEAPAELALKFNIPLWECFPERQADGKYIIRQNKIEYSDLEYSKENVRIVTERHVSILERQIEKNPGQWAWMHNKWKHKPKYDV